MQVRSHSVQLSLVPSPAIFRLPMLLETFQHHAKADMFKDPCLVYNAICLLVLTYSPPIWFKDQKQLSKILQDVQDELKW